MLKKHLCLLALAALFALLSAPPWAAATTLSGGKYDVIIAIDPAMAEDYAMVDNIKTMMIDASKYMHKALKQQAMFGKVSILIPDSWTANAGYPTVASEGETAAGADILVGKNVACGACASPGKIQIDDGSMQGSTVIHEWGHYRFNLGDEYCDYVLKVDPADNNQKWYQVYKTAAGWNRCTSLQDIQRSCDERLQTGPACALQKNDTNGATASIMHRQANAGIEYFCDNSTDPKLMHNSSVNNHQNRIWSRKSTWEAIEANGDGFKMTGGTTVTYADPTFELKKAAKADIVIVIDVSGSMDSYSRLTNAVSAAKIFIDSVEAGCNVGIVQFSDTASQLLPLTAVTNAASRTTIKAALPSSTINMTSIGAGLQSAAAILNASVSGQNKVIVLLTDGG